VLLRLGADAPDGSRLETAAAQRCVPLKTLTITDREAIQLYEKRLVLVRPDGHVAWRGDTTPLDGATVIDRVRGFARLGNPSGSITSANWPLPNLGAMRAKRTCRDRRANFAVLHDADGVCAPFTP
jgi:hypothetical protein